MARLGSIIVGASPKQGRAVTEKAQGDRFYRIGKRAVDVAAAVLILALFSPLLLLIVLLIRVDSKGSPIFRQVRVGKDGKLFNFYKFRSMIRDADRRKASLRELNEAEEPLFKIRDDPRITRVGRVLRKTSLDELPQMLNVLKGDMSLVGPRPHLPEEVERYTEEQRGRLSVTPGITCLWQATHRCSTQFNEWIRSDLEYVRNRSPWLDIKILIQTVWIVLSWKEAS